MGSRFIAATAAVVLALVMAAGPSAMAKSKGKGTPKPTPSGGAVSCEAVTPGAGKGPVSKQALSDTALCFDNFIGAIGGTAGAVDGFASACATTPESGREEEGPALIKLANSGLKEVGTTKKAKAAYFHAELDSYYVGKRDKGDIRDKLDNVIAAIGKTGLQLEGFYTAAAGMGSALSNNDCGEVSAKAAAADAAIAKAKTELSNLHTALNALK